MASLYNNISQIYQEQEEHEKALESLDKALELIKKMENSEAEVATTHVNRALSLMALGRLDEADEELKESLTFYASPEGVQSGHFGSALAAAGELAWRRGNYDQAIGLLEKALMVTQSRFGESDACAVIRQNLEMIKKEKEEKGITGRQGRKPEPLCELSVQGCEVLRQDKKKAFFEKFSDERFDKKRARNAHGKKILKIEKT